MTYTVHIQSTGRPHLDSEHTDRVGKVWSAQGHFKRTQLVGQRKRTNFGTSPCASESGARSPPAITGRHGCGRTLAVARNSSCPERTWLNAVGPLLLNKKMVFINAGANKGYHVAEFLQRFHSDAAEAAGWRTNGDWMAAIKSVKKTIHAECGVCHECTAPPPTIRLHAPSVEVHALELMACNHHLIDSVFRKLRVPGIAYRMAAANRSGVVYGPSNCGMGNEGSSALMRNKSGRHARSNLAPGGPVQL